MIGKKINQLATELAPVSTDLTIIGDPISGVSKKITLAQLGAIFSGAVSFYTNLAGFPATGDINVIYCAKDTQKLYLWSGSAYTEVFPSQALLDTYQLRSEKGVSNGYASLDSTGKVPISQLPSSIMEYKGTWNASTNTPTLANGTGDTGDVYICNVAGTVNFGAGPITFAVGDYVIYSGSIWQRSSGAVGTVTSVAASITGNAIGITGSPVTTSGTLAFAFAGTGAQYIKGDGTLATFPSTIAQAERLITEVYNSTGATLTKGTIVYINGGQGNLPTVTKALATGDSTSAQTFGVVQADITNNNNGYVVVAGKLSDLDTQAYTPGTQLYLSSTTAGTWTSTKQYAPNHLVYIGIVVRAHPTQGIVEIKIQNGYEMDELHNVAAQNPDNNDILQYKTATSLWTKVAGTTSNIAEGSNLYYTDARSRAALSFTVGSGAYNSTTGVITIPTNTNQLTNGAAYITLGSLSAGAGISYNNTTGVIASTITQYTDAMARAAISGGTGISYNSTTGVITNTITQYTDAMARASISLTTTGTSGAATYNSTTGVLNVPQYAPDLSGYVPTSRTLTINGTAFDLSANRSWSVGTVTSVGLSSATSGVTIGSTPVTTSGTITLAIATASGSQQGLLSSTDWTTFNNKQNALTNPVTGTGTTNYLPKFTGTSTIGNSLLVDNGTNLTYNGEELVINKSGGSFLTLLSGDSDTQYIQFKDTGGASASIRYNHSTNAMIFKTNGSDYLTLTASGNLGLGVTPSAWGSALRVIQGPNSDFVFTSRYPYVLSNAFFDTSWKYVNSEGASFYVQAAGQHQWFNAPSGTAGNAISFTQAMTLNASGNLSIGNTNDTYKLDVSGTGRFRNSDGSDLIRYTATGVNTEYATKIVSGANDVLVFRRQHSTAGALDIMALGFNGNVGIGTTSPSGRLHILNASGSGQPVLELQQQNAGSNILQWRGSAGSYLGVISNDGNVGIGTTSPTQTLQVNGTTLLAGPSSTPVTLQVSSSNGNCDITIQSANSSGPSRIRNYVDDLQFHTNGSERLRITSGGNLLVGTTSDNGRRLRVSQSSADYVAQISQLGSSGGSHGLTIDCNSSSSSIIGLEIYSSSASAFRTRLFTDGSATFSGDVKVKTLEVTNATTYGSSAGISTYMQIKVNGQNYVIPLHGTP